MINFKVETLGPGFSCLVAELGWELYLFQARARGRCPFFGGDWENFFLVFVLLPENEK